MSEAWEQHADAVCSWCWNHRMRIGVYCSEQCQAEAETAQYGKRPPTPEPKEWNGNLQP